MGAQGAAMDARADKESADEEAAPHFSRDFEQLPNGEIIWNASLVLLHYLRGLPAEHFRGQRVLGLGSGLGHLGFRLAKLGAHVPITEQEKCIPFLRETLAELSEKEGAPDIGS